MNYTVNPVYLSGSNVDIVESVATRLIPLELEYLASTNIEIKNKSVVYEDGFRFYTNSLLNNVKDSASTKNTLFYLTSGITWDEFVYDGNNPNVGVMNNDTKVLFDRLNNTGFFYAFVRDGNANQSFMYLNDEDEFGYIMGVTAAEKSLIKFVKLSNDKVKISFFKDEVRNDRDESTEYLLTVDVLTYRPTLKLRPVKEKFDHYIQEFNIYLINDKISISYEQNILEKYNNDQTAAVIDDIYSPARVTERFIGIKEGDAAANGVIRHYITDGTENNTSKYSGVAQEYKTASFVLYNPGYTALTLGIEEESQNVWIGYYNELFDKTNNKGVTPNLDLTVSKVPINYLVTSNYKNHTNLEGQSVGVNIIPLKSTYTPEQETIKTETVVIDGALMTDAPENLQPVQRTYTKLFVSNNEMDNYSKVNLGYSASTKELKFGADEITYFHYPLQADRISLADGNLIEAGALPGATPYLSDKIFMKNAAYGAKGVWGHLTPPPGCLNGTFLCSWLSGSDASSLSGLEESVWVDRWYDSSSVTEISALHTSTNAISSNLGTSIVFDAPTQMVLNPGGWYHYHHIGNNITTDFIDSFNLGTTGCRLNLQCDAGGMVDESNYKNIIEITNRKDNTFVVSNPDEALEDNFVLSLDGTNYGKIQYAPSIDLTDDITVSMWVHSDKWTNNPGYHLLDNGFRGGWAISMFNGFYNPTISVGETYYGHALNFSDNLTPYADNMLIPRDSNSLVIPAKISPDNLITTDDFYTYVFDRENKSLGKFEYTGDLIDIIDLSTYGAEISNSKLVMGPDERLYLHFNDTLLTTDVNFTSTTSASLPYTNFVLDLSGKIIGGDFVDVAVDNNNIIWYISACPAEFFTYYDQPTFTPPSPFFVGYGHGDIDKQYDASSLHDALTSNGDLNFVFYCNTETGPTSSKPIAVQDLNGNLITFAAFFPNNAENGIISKFYQPTRLIFDKDNHMYLTNDTHEVMKLIVAEDQQVGIIAHKSLIDEQLTTGLNLSAINDYRRTLIDETNAVNRLRPGFEYTKMQVTSTLWSDVESKYYYQNYLNLLYEYDELTETYKTFLYYTDNQRDILYKLDSNGEYISNVKITDGIDIQTAPTIDVSFTNYTNVATSYNWHRKYTWNQENTRTEPRIKLDLYTIDSFNNIEHHVLESIDGILIDTEWHHVSFTYSTTTGIMNLYVDGVTVDTKTVTPGLTIYYKYNNDIGAGTSMLRSGSLLEELKTPSYIMNGMIDDVRMYDHVLTRGNIGRLIINKYKIHDMIWNILVGSKNYIEEVQHFFKHKTPGSKSALYDLYLTNTGIDDEEIRTEIENIIKESVSRVSPGYTRLNKIYWK